MSEEDTDDVAGPDTARGTSAPRAFTFNQYSFNFKVDLGARIGARYGAPAFSQRRAKLHRNTTSFWSTLEERYEELWTAAREGRIGDDGREVRQSLLHSDGTDRMGHRDHKRRLFGQKVDPEAHARAEFNRAWLRQVDTCGLTELAMEHEDFAKYFPIESNMPVDPESNHLVWMGEPWIPPVAPTREDVLGRFPLRE
ncbi:MAG: hypothetical protein KDA24_06370 [Deltaproteobacteria bacterium]|nr:hypothetical protein [Deltaproteobacteria bacterium]